MDFKAKILEFLKKEEVALTRSWEWAKDARDRAPSAAESHSDTTRSEQEKLVQALERDIKTLRGYLREVEKMSKRAVAMIGKWSYVELDSNGIEMKVFMVREGMGGKSIGEVRLVSVAAPLGKALEGKGGGETAEINGRVVKIRRVE